MSASSDLKVVIVGAGVEGQAAARYFIRRGAKNVTLADAVERALPDGCRADFGPDYLRAVEGADVVVASPGLFAEARRLIQNAGSTGAIVTSNLRIFLEGLPILGAAPCPAPVIGVTGSNGKTTCTSLLFAMLERAGNRRVWLGGNIGTGPLDFVDEVRSEDLVVLELSSFQLLPIERSPWLGIVLNVTPNHLDQHADFQEYVLAKRRVVDRPGNAWAVLNTADAVCAGWIRDHSYTGELLPFDGDAATLPIPQSEIAVKTHPETIAAACVAARVAGVSDADIETVLRSFTGVEHRLQLIRTLNGVRWYDDSANTTPESTIVALRAFEPGTTVIILGGSDKGTPFDALAREVVARKARVVLMGQTAPLIAAAIHAVDPAYPLATSLDFPSVMETTRRLAKPGDAVLLSPACASFGMFQNYKDRAAQFTRIVEGWAGS